MKKHSLILIALVAGAACLLSALSRSHPANYAKVLPVATTTEEPSFQDFLKQFPAQPLPYEISKDKLAKLLSDATKTGERTHSKGERLPYAYYQFLPSLNRFSRMPEYAEPVARLETERKVAVIYNITHGYAQSWKNYQITVFDKEGNAISTNYLAGIGTEDITAALVTADLQAVQTPYQVIWKKDYQAYGIEGNKIETLVPREVITVDLTKPTDNLRRKRREASPLAPDVPAAEEKTTEQKS